MTYRLSAIAAAIAFLCMGCCCPCGAPMAAFQQIASQAAQQAAKAAAEQAQYKNDLKQLGLAFHNYHDLNGRAPENWNELLDFAIDEQEVLRKLQGKGTTVVWGVSFKDVLNGTSNTALAYNPAVGGMGGAVLMFDGSVRDVQPGELNDYLYNPNGVGEAPGDGAAVDASGLGEVDSVETDDASGFGDPTNN